MGPHVCVCVMCMAPITRHPSFVTVVRVGRGKERNDDHPDQAFVTMPAMMNMLMTTLPVYSCCHQIVLPFFEKPLHIL